MAADDKAGTAPAAAAARMPPPLGEREPVVERQLRAGGNFSSCDNPNPAANHLDAAIRGTGMIDQPGDISPCATVEVVPAVQGENVNTVITAPPLSGETLRLAPHRFRLGDSLAGVFDDARIRRDRFPRTDAATVDSGKGGDNPPGRASRVGVCAKRCDSRERKVCRHPIPFVEPGGSSNLFRAARVKQSFRPSETAHTALWTGETCVDHDRATVGAARPSWRFASETRRGRRGSSVQNLSCAPPGTARDS